MRIPKTTPIRTARETVTAFGGYDYRPVISAGSWYDQENVTADLYPTATVRKKHGTKTLEGGTGAVTGIFEANGKLGYTRYVSAGTPAADHGTVTFYEPDATDPSTVDLGLSSTTKKFVHMGAYLIIYPDQKWINTADDTDYGDMDPIVTASNDPFDVGAEKILLVGTCKKDGTDIQYTQSGGEPQNPSDGQYWYNKHVSPATFKRFDAESGEWLDETPYQKIKLAAPYDISFKEGETVKLSYNLTTVGGSNGDGPLASGYKELIKVGTDTSGNSYIVVQGNPFEASYVLEWTMTISYDIPDMDYVVESNNRLWGCKWGGAKHVNEIYASALGSFKEWNRFDGSDADSYVASVGSDGPFTGAVSFQGRPVFFKERCMHVIYGSYPSAYQIVSTECHGIEAGCDRSAALVDNVLYYKSPEGFAAYDGSLPQLFGAELGDVKYKKVSAGGYDKKYFAAAVDEAGKAHVLIYDTRLGLWQHAESRPYSTASLAVTTLFAEAEDEMCYVDAGDSFATVKTWFGSGTKDSGAVKWYAETGDLGLGDLFAKYVILIAIRMRLAAGSRLRVRIKYDDGPWEHVSDRAGHSLAKFTLPIRVRRCDHFRIRLEGVGDAQLYAIERTIQGGSRK